MRAGTKLRAGLGWSTVLADFDFETYSEAGFRWDETAGRWKQPHGASGTKKGLPIVGAAVYAQHPTTEVLCLAYNLKDGRGPRQWRPGMPPPADLLHHIASGQLIEAWNVAFEYWIWTEVCVPRFGWPALQPRSLRCAMAKARAFGLPGKLEEAGRVLNVPIQKDADGKRLLDRFSMPRNPTKADARKRILIDEDPVDGPRLLAYNLTDIEAEAEVSARCPDLEGDELEFWISDQAINRRGVHIDLAGVRNCISIVEQQLERSDRELITLTGGAVSRASEVQGLRTWLATQGVHMLSLDEESVAATLKELEAAASDAWSNPGEPVRAAYRALEIRQAAGSASVKKVFAMALQAARGDRLHDLFQYYAARTGRPTGNGPQPTNLPKAGPDVVRCGYDGPRQFARGCGRYHRVDAPKCPWCGVEGPPGRKAEWCVDAAESALLILGTRNLQLVEHFFGAPLLTVSGCLRALFNAAEGKQLVSSDFTAIEAVVIAAIAGELWRLEVFRNKADIYLESISRSTGTPVDEMKAYKKQTGMHHPLRQKGKIQELSLGFGGWLGALRAFGAEGTEQELKNQIVAWRNASPAIVELWGGQSRDFGRIPGMYGLEGAAVTAMLSPGVRQDVMRRDGSWTGVSYVHQGTVLYCLLPSGRALAYQNPKLTPTGTWRGLSLTFEGWNTNAKKGPPGWQTMDLYGGLLAENVTQAVARDIQRAAINTLEASGYPVVLHVYDEDVAECNLGLEGLEAIMGTMPTWADGWPIGAAGGWVGPRYQKA